MLTSDLMQSISSKDHYLGNTSTPSSSTTTHLIWPPETSKAHAARLWLVPFHCWINLTHSNMFLHSPFDFATVNWQKPTILFLNPTGTFYLDLRTHSCGLTYHHTQFKLTVAFKSPIATKSTLPHYVLHLILTTSTFTHDGKRPQVWLVFYPIFWTTNRDSVYFTRWNCAAIACLQLVCQMTPHFVPTCQNLSRLNLCQHFVWPLK